MRQEQHPNNPVENFHNILNNKTTRRAFLRRVIGLGPNGKSLKYTVAESILVLIGTTAISLAAENIGLPIGDTQSNMIGSSDTLEEFVKNRPLEAGVQMIGTSPLKEEAVFRLVPSSMLDLASASKGVRWGIGGLSSALFAAIHNQYFEKKTNQPRFRTDVIPLQQLFGGAYFWKLMRERGYLHALAAHAVSNSAFFLLIATKPSNPTKN